jgi:hypothetical protein
MTPLTNRYDVVFYRTQDRSPACQEGYDVWLARPVLIALRLRMLGPHRNKKRAPIYSIEAQCAPYQSC